MNTRKQNTPSNFGKFRRTTGYPIQFMIATGWDGAWRGSDSEDVIYGEFYRVSAGLNLDKADILKERI